MKRVFAILAFLVIASMLLGACTPAASPTAVPPTKPPAAAADPTKAPADRRAHQGPGAHGDRRPLASQGPAHQRGGGDVPGQPRSPAHLLRQ